jgi:ADP-L-glycero-D-manno-heptose 6-epimerase
MKASYLVTGAAGFIGSQFVRSCNGQGIPVISVDQKSHFTQRTENHGIQFGNIVDREHLIPWLNEHQPQLAAIVHLGAVTDTRETDLERLNRLNLDYSKTIWNFSTQHKIPLVYASSAATYGDGEFGYSDNEALIPNLKPLNLYGDSKQQFDLWVLEQEARNQTPPHWAGFKFFNVFGFGERHKGFMSSVVLHAFDQIQEKGQVTLFKSHKQGIPDGFQKRDFIFVGDVINAIHFALNKPIQRGIFNLGSGHARTFLDLARAVFRTMKKPENIQFVDTPKSIRDKYQYFTEAEMGKLLAQEYPLPFTTLEDGVHSYVSQLLESRNS